MHAPFTSIKNIDAVLMFVVLPWGGNRDLACAKSAHSNLELLARTATLSLISARDLHDVYPPSRHPHNLKIIGSGG